MYETLPGMWYLEPGSKSSSLRSFGGATPWYWGDRLAADGDLVVVTFNYRLNVFGFMAHPELEKEDENGSTGSYGTLDQVAALQWTHDNIAAFGGDPGQVTIFGESAGGWSICTLLATPLTKGLIHGAILESGFIGSEAVPEPGSFTLALLALAALPVLTRRRRKP